MEEQKITAETSLLAKEKGMYGEPLKTDCVAIETLTNGKTVAWDISPGGRSFNVLILYPQSIVQRWLRDRDIHVEVFHGRDKDDESKIYYEVAVYKDSDCKAEFYKQDLNTYEEALEQGLKHALTLIK